MRGFQCYLYYKNKENKLEKISNTACFAGLNRASIRIDDLSKTSLKIIDEKIKKGLNGNIFGYIDILATPPYENSINIKELSDEPNIIYIEDFSEEETIPYMEYLIKLINKITPCEIITINKIQYLKVELLETYNQSLLVLNFLRNLWHTPGFAIIGGGARNTDYTTIFFKELKNKYKDPLKKLLYANMKASAGAQYPAGHSNVIGPGEPILRTTKELLEATSMTNTQNFINKP